jgi:SAM-dependent methyltransferase
MNFEQVAKRLSPPIALDVIRWLLGRNRNNGELQRYLSGGRVPWSPGYSIYKAQLIVQALADEILLERFRRGEPLPPSYGVGVDERCIEYPWLLAHLCDGSEVLLDAGSTLNHDFILDHPVFQHKVIHILTLAPETNCFWQKGISYLFGDLRDILVRDAYYDIIVCLSTLEHVGCDNTFFTHNCAYQEHSPGDFVLVMQELCRVLKPGGSLFLTVPFGVYRHFGTFQQFDRNLLSRAVEAFGQASKVTETFYRYTAEGWSVADAADCAECEYVEWITRPRDQWPTAFPVEPDLAAAARSVACVRLGKG